MTEETMVSANTEALRGSLVTVHTCTQCGNRPATGFAVDRGFARMCARCLNAMYGVDDR